MAVVPNAMIDIDIAIAIDIMYDVDIDGKGLSIRNLQPEQQHSSG